MREPIKPKGPSKYIDEFIYSRVSDTSGNLQEVVNDIELQLIEKGYKNCVVNLFRISYEFDACSSYSSCCFMYKLESEKPKEIYEKELKKYEVQMRLYNKEKNKFNLWKKDKEDKKKEQRKELYEKLKKEFCND